jgi:hypothetical protein
VRLLLANHLTSTDQSSAAAMVIDRSAKKAAAIMVDFFGHLSLSYWIQSSCEKMVPMYPRCVPIHRL